MKKAIEEMKVKGKLLEKKMLVSGQNKMMIAFVRAMTAQAIEALKAALHIRRDLNKKKEQEAVT